MTRLYIDKQEIAPLPADVNSLDQVLKLVESNHLARNTAVRQIEVDGHPLIRNEGAAGFAENICDGEKIEIFTASLYEVAVDSIREAVTYLERAETAIPSLSASLRIQAERETSSSLRQFYEGIYVINLLLQRLEQSFQVPFAELETRSGSARDCCIRLAALLKEVIDAHGKQDFALLADLLERQIGPLIPAFKEIFEAINSRILMEQ